jgi:hypothetical protein
MNNTNPMNDPAYQATDSSATKKEFKKSDGFINLEAILTDANGHTHRLRVPIWGLNKGQSKVVDAILANPTKAAERITVQVSSVHLYSDAEITL